MRELDRLLAQLEARRAREGRAHPDATRCAPCSSPSSGIRSSSSARSNVLLSRSGQSGASRPGGLGDRGRRPAGRLPGLGQAPASRVVGQFRPCGVSCLLTSAQPVRTARNDEPHWTSTQTVVSRAPGAAGIVRGRGRAGDESRCGHGAVQPGHGRDGPAAGRRSEDRCDLDHRQSGRQRDARPGHARYGPGLAGAGGDHPSGLQGLESQRLGEPRMEAGL